MEAGRGLEHLFSGCSVLKSLNTAENSFLVPWQRYSHLRQVLSRQLQHTLHGVQPSRTEVQDVALHAYGFKPLRDTSIRDPIRATQAGQA